MCDGDVQREGRRAMYEPPTGVIGSSGEEGEDGCARLLGFRQWGAQNEKSKRAIFGLKTGQRRDVTEKDYANVATFGAT